MGFGRGISVFVIAFLVLTLPLGLAQSKSTTTLSKTDDSVYISKTSSDLRAKLDSIAATQKAEVIINAKPGKANEVLSKAPASAVIDYFGDVIGMTLTKDQVKQLARESSVLSMGNVVKLRPMLNEAVDITNAEDVWVLDVGNGQVGIDGDGVGICIIDSGVDFTHPDLAAKNIVGNNLNCHTVGAPNNPCWVDPADTDLLGHGTHVAGIAAAAGGINGIAKGANIISMDVFGNSSTTGAWDVQRAISWCIDHKDDYNIKVISVSLGSDVLYSGVCNGAPENGGYVNWINNANNAGLPVVAASGNSGSSTQIVAPACIDKAIAVGATMDSDSIWPSSNYNSNVKLFAPGSPIVSTCVGGGYCGNSGTSASTPMVSGAIAIIQGFLESRNSMSEMTPLELENLLFEFGDPVTNLPFASHRRIDILAAVMDFEESKDLGDVNLDGVRDISDPVFLLDYLFGGTGLQLPCTASANVNGGTVEVGDAISILDHIFGNAVISAGPVGCFPL
jgi:subtilisin family serine protease